MNFAILKNDFDEGHLNWIEACQKKHIPYHLIDLTKSDWLKKTTEKSYDAYLACPPGREEHFKKMYDERIYILDKVLNKLVYPSYNEISVHENKKYLSYWLSSQKIHHPKTYVFYQKSEAFDFANSCNYPIVGKMNIGASGKGVVILYNKNDLEQYINKAFSTGLRKAWGPNLKMGDYKNRLLKILTNPGKVTRKLKIYSKNYNVIQKDYVILQEYIEHDYEWRVVKIGNSYFGHQKVKQGEKASGTKGINYVIPPEKLLDFVHELCDKHNFKSMAVDLFEDQEDGYLVNELQCIFGHVQEYICEKDGKPGRILQKDKRWIFEEGLFNTNLSYDLRLQNVISIISDK